MFGLAPRVLGWFSQGHFLSITTLAAGSAQTDRGCCCLPGLVLIKFPGMLVKREAAVLGIILLKNTAHTKQLSAGFQQGPAELPHCKITALLVKALLRPALTDL